MASGYKIRFAVPSDALQILEAHRQAIVERARDFYDQEIIKAWAFNPDDKKSVARIESEISDSDFIVLAAEAASKILGFAMVKCSGEELRAVYVAPNKYKGVGRELLACIEEEARKRGVKNLGLDSSLNAESFYVNKGYKVIGRAIHHLPSGRDMTCVKMEKNLG
jgi:N-acetylglutamate synthase-like GNAT family acetyltransferase